jgi:hypothetical protein
MGRGDNRKTLKHRRRKAQRKLKGRIAKKIELGKANKGKGGVKKAASAPAKTTVTRKST